MIEYRAPGEKWDRDDINAFGALFERGERGLALFADGGPYSGERVQIGHIEWSRWVIQVSDDETLDVAMPPGYLLDMSNRDGEPIGYYVFDRDSEMLRWVAV